MGERAQPDSLQGEDCLQMAKGCHHITQLPSQELPSKQGHEEAQG